MPPAKFHDCLTELSSANFAENISQGKCFVLFYAADSGSCDKMRYNLGKIAENEQGTIRFFKLNIDDYPETALNYQISNTPNTLIFKNGEVLKRITGAIPKRNLEIIYNRISKK